jgi:hypothetical protein
MLSTVLREFHAAARGQEDCSCLCGTVHSLRSYILEIEEEIRPLMG